MALSWMRGLVTRTSKSRRSIRASSRRPAWRGLELLEGRELLATFLVSNLGDSGSGSLRQAMIDANSTPGPDDIDFSVAGVVHVGPTSLPALSDTVAIDGTTAPGFAGAPVVTVDFGGTSGFDFAAGSDGSMLKALAIVNAGNSGVTLDASQITVAGNNIGLLADGTTVAGSNGDGIRVNATSHDDLIGQVNPVSSIDYYDTSAVSVQPVSGWQGIRNASTPDHYLITGTSQANGLLYIGPITGAGGTTYLVNDPVATSTSVYGPDDLGDGLLRLVGSYRDGGSTVHGFLFEGTTVDLSTAANYTTIDYPGAQFNYVHSTMGGLAVGNADGPEGNLPIGTGHAFMWDVASHSFLPDIVYPGSTSTTAYGIWHNGGTSYTIAGGYTTGLDPTQPVSNAYLVDYDSATGQYTHWTSFAYPNGVVGKDYVAHFEGLSSPEKGVYTISGDSAETGAGHPVQGSLIAVHRNADGTFGHAYWVDLHYPGTVGLTSANSVAGNQVVGITLGSPSEFSYQATVNLDFQLSNVISGNHGNGIGIYGASRVRVAMNQIGTDESGQVALGNAANGILVTNGAADNYIGGQVSAGNDPTADLFVRPPQGNLISGNGNNGVCINNGATRTLLSGNFIGTGSDGNEALGNHLNGVAIDHSNGNLLIGCTVQQSPFVYYNVISGNGQNGLQINSSNNTTVQGNFFGIGADNAIRVPNGGDGVLVSGTSQNIQLGGVIPLGNVISGNTGNGLEVRDTASGLISFNTFAGLYAFGGAAPNGGDGILITSTGGNNLIRTCLVGGNLGNGIEITGHATGVQVTETGVGTDSLLLHAIPNGGSGIVISGSAHGNAIGGFQPSIEPRNTISGNGRYGVEILGSAYSNSIVHSFIGTDGYGIGPLGNGLGGIYLGPGTRSTLIGGSSDAFRNRICFNTGNGVTLMGSSGNQIFGNTITWNAGCGVAVNGGRSNQIGGRFIGNTISNNAQTGVYVTGLLPLTSIQGNQITSNGGDGITLFAARMLLVGGIASGGGNWVTGNHGFGLAAYGPGYGSVLWNNLIFANTRGDIDLSHSQGVIVVPPTRRPMPLV